MKRQVASLALPTFLASAASTLPLQDTITVTSLCPQDGFMTNTEHPRRLVFGSPPE